MENRISAQLFFVMAFAWASVGYAMEESFESLDLEAQLALLEREDQKDEQRLAVFLDQKPLDEGHPLTPEEQFRLACEVSLLEPQNLYGNSVIPHMAGFDENDPELQQALALSFSKDTISEQKDHQRPVEEWEGMEEALQASLISAQEEQGKEKQSLIQNILAISPQIIDLYADNENMARQVSDAWRDYYQNKESADASEKYQKWAELYRKQTRIFSVLSDQTSGISEAIQKYFTLGFHPGLREDYPLFDLCEEIKELQAMLAEKNGAKKQAIEKILKLSSGREESQTEKTKITQELLSLRKEIEDIELKWSAVIVSGSEKINQYFVSQRIDF